jgi:hypothetical protein
MTMKQMTDDIVASSDVNTDGRGHTPAKDDLFEVNDASPRCSTSEEGWFRTYVAKLLYLAKRARPDVLLPVSWLTTRATRCTSEDVCKLRKVIGYVAATSSRGIVIDFGLKPRVRAYVDASFATHNSDGKSHTGGSVLFGKGGPLYSTSVKQSIVTKSSTEAELVAASDVASEVLCLRNFAIGQGYPPLPAIIYQDNKPCMQLIEKGGPCSQRSRHIDIRQFWVTEQVAAGHLVIEKCPTEIMWANLLTKPLQGAQFVIERKGITNWDSNDDIEGVC